MNDAKKEKTRRDSTPAKVWVTAAEKAAIAENTLFLMTPSSGESIGLAALRIMQVFQANRSSTFVWRGFPRAKRIP